VDKQFFFTDFFAKSIYTAYIIHIAFPLKVATKALILVLEATGNILYVVDEQYFPHYFTSNVDLSYCPWLFVHLGDYLNYGGWHLLHPRIFYDSVMANKYYIYFEFPKQS
jgi:hypothetical protein